MICVFVDIIAESFVSSPRVRISVSADQLRKSAPAPHLVQTARKCIVSAHVRRSPRFNGDPRSATVRPSTLDPEIVNAHRDTRKAPDIA
jgi:hypothetical protein